VSPSLECLFQPYCPRLWIRCLIVTCIGRGDRLGASGLDRVRRLHLSTHFLVLTQKDDSKLAIFLFVFDPAKSRFQSVCRLQAKDDGPSYDSIHKVLPTQSSYSRLHAAVLVMSPIFAASQSVPSGLSRQRVGRQP
jgi:hypothetical protein